MGKRFAIVIGVAAAGVMALGAQTALAGGAPDLQLSGDKKQSQGIQPGCTDRCGPWAVAVNASCGHEACTLSAKGKLTNVKNDKLEPHNSVDLEPGETRTLHLRLTEKTRKKARKALADGKNVQAKITVKATDADGNVATAKRTIRLVEGSSPGEPRTVQTAAEAPDVVKYDTELTITTERGFLYHGSVLSDRDGNPGYDPAKAVRECMDGRRVILFKQRRGADRRLATLRSEFRPDYGRGDWGMPRGPGMGHARVYAKVRPKVSDGFVCRADRSPTI